MKSHQFDLKQGQILRIGIHSVTVLEIDIDSGEVVLQIEDPDGHQEVAVLRAAAEPMLV